MNKIIASAAVAIALAAGATAASAEPGYGYGHGYGNGYRGVSQSEAFARQAARDGRITRDEARIINELRAREAYVASHHHHYRPWYRRWW